MTLPVVTMECLTAVLDKAMQTGPEKFAEAVMLELSEEQPALMAAFTSVLEPFMEACNVTEYEGHEIDFNTRREMMIMSHFCVMGIALKALSAQVDAAEMDEVWS